MQIYHRWKKPLLNPPLQYITYIQFARKVTIIKVEPRAIEEVVYWFPWQFGLNCVYIQRGSDGQRGFASGRVLYALQGNWRQCLAFLAVEKRWGRAYQIWLPAARKLTISIVSGIYEYKGDLFLQPCGYPSSPQNCQNRLGKNYIRLPKFSDMGETLCSGDFRGRWSTRFRLTCQSLVLFQFARGSQLPNGLDYRSDSAGKLRSEEGGFMVVNYRAIQTAEATVLVDDFRDSRVPRLPCGLN